MRVCCAASWSITRTVISEGRAGSVVRFGDIEPGNGVSTKDVSAGSAATRKARYRLLRWTPDPETRGARLMPPPRSLMVPPLVSVVCTRARMGYGQAPALLSVEIPSDRTPVRAPAL